MQGPIPPKDTIIQATVEGEFGYWRIVQDLGGNGYIQVLLQKTDAEGTERGGFFTAFWDDIT